MSQHVIIVHLLNRAAHFCDQHLFDLTKFLTGDKIIVLAEDDDTYEPGEPGQYEIKAGCPDWKPKRRTERILFLGWRRDMHAIIAVLDKFVDHGSELWLYNEVQTRCCESRVVHVYHWVMQLDMI